MAVSLPRPLWVEGVWISGAALTMVGAAAQLVHPVWGGASWLAAAGVAALVVTLFWGDAGRLALDDADFGALTWATRITVLRGLLLAILAGMACAAEATVGMGPALVFALGALLDGADGWMARRMGQVSRLGASLDNRYDALALLLGSATAVRFGGAPWWYLGVGLVYYAFYGALRWRESLGGGVHREALGPSMHVRFAVGLQFVALTAALFGGLSGALGRTVLTLLMLPIVAGFLRDWFLVCGLWQRHAGAYPRWRRRGLSLLLRWVPLPLRLGVAALSGLGLFWGPQGIFACGVLAAGALGALLGVAPRALALLLVGQVAVTQTALPPAWSQALAALSTAIVYLGGGAWTLWNPEERWVFRRWGTPA